MEAAMLRDEAHEAGRRVRAEKGVDFGGDDDDDAFSFMRAIGGRFQVEHLWFVWLYDNATEQSRTSSRRAL
jgi:hypothetical protein